jgi:hypothetical protein
MCTATGCLCVNVYCHRVSTQLQLTNISIKIYVLLYLGTKIGLYYHSAWIALSLGNCFNFDMYTDRNLDQLNVAHRPFQSYNSS